MIPPIIVYHHISQCHLASVDQLYAYSYQPQPSYTSNNGWKIYDPLHEYERMGVGTKNDNWRFTTINRDYTVSCMPNWRKAYLIMTCVSSIPQLTHAHWSSQPKSATMFSTMQQSIVVRQGYQSSPIFIGTTW